MRKIPTALLFLLLFTSALSAQDFTPAVLPPCPRGCEIHVYGPIKRFPNLIPKGAERTSDWTPYFKSVGLTFKKGGFAYFHRPTRTLIVATIPADFDLIETVMGKGF